MGLGARNYQKLALDATAVAVVDRAVNVYGLTLINNDPSNTAFIKFYNKRIASITVGTTVPDKIISVPAGGQVILRGSDHPYVFDLALGIAAVIGLAATAGTTSPTNGVYVEFEYL
jgi:hypothetical protein